MNVGDTFLTVSDALLDHLWVVITKPDAAGNVVMVNVTTKVADSDESCVLLPGDHPFIQHDSVMAYEKARIANAAQLDEFVRKRYLQPRPTVGPTVLGRIQNGALASIYTPRGVKTAVRAELGIK